MNSITEKPFVFGCIGMLCICSLLSLIVKDSDNKIGLVPVNTLIANHYVWNLVTSSFYERNFLKLAVDVALFILVNQASNFNNHEQFGMYFALTLISCTVGASAYCFIRFFGTKLEEMLITPIYGFSGVLTCFLMYARQQRKNEPIIPSFPLITFQNLPILVVFGQIIFWSVGLLVFAVDLPFTIISLLFSWSYLRFYYKYDEQSALGDRSDDFAFIAMFPVVGYVI